MYDTLNMFPQAANILHDIELSDEDKSRRKGIFLEGLIRFMDIYSQTEIAEGIELDITKIALHINSALFENDDLYGIESIEDVFRLCESLAIIGLPLWRFCKLNNFQSMMLERQYKKLLKEINKSAKENKCCYNCIWYDEAETFLGTLCECRKPRTDFNWASKGRKYFDPDETKICNWYTSLDDIPGCVEELVDMPGILQRNKLKENFISAIEPAREKYRKKLEQDNFRIPQFIPEKEQIDISIEYEPLSDIGRIMNNKRGKIDMQRDVRRSMYAEGMIRFFSQYAECEMGTGFMADIAKISEWLDEQENSFFDFIKSYDDVYGNLEKKIINGFPVDKFVKYDVNN